MRITIMGTGGVGGTSAPGWPMPAQDVSFVARGAQLAAIRATTACASRARAATCTCAT